MAPESREERERGRKLDGEERESEDQAVRVNGLVTELSEGYSVINDPFLGSF